MNRTTGALALVALVAGIAFATGSVAADAGGDLGICVVGIESPFDILPALKGEDSPKGIFRLRVSSVLKYAFAWNVDGRHRVVTTGVLFSA